MALRGVTLTISRREPEAPVVTETLAVQSYLKHKANATHKVVIREEE